jgi:hypothetical protein
MHLLFEANPVPTNTEQVQTSENNEVPEDFGYEQCDDRLLLKEN